MCSLLLAASCADRPLTKPCKSGFDCTVGDWCVSTWWVNDADVQAGNVCAAQCSSDVDCGGAPCMQVGTGVTADVSEPLYFACRE